VDVIPGSRWGERFEQALHDAPMQMAVSAERLATGPASFEYANVVMAGLASLRAAQLETDVVALAVWDGSPGDGPGGTASAVRLWRRLGYRVAVIDVRKIMSGARPVEARTLRKLPSAEAHPRKRRDQSIPRAVKTTLFADVTGFSRLTEQQFAPFINQYLAAVSRLVEVSPVHPVLKNTWGDGLILGFSHASQAAAFAVQMNQLISSVDWERHGLPGDFAVRISLHAGPAVEFRDPVTGRRNLLGYHVNRAARMEPITPPGEVYASQEFAALLAVEGAPGLACEYVGRVALAKDFGTYPLYRIYAA
jgi:class 3 adenylate cyclase